MAVPLLPRAPIDEVVIGVVLDQPLGLDAVGAGVYLAQRQDLFVRHEIHEAILPPNTVVEMPGPTRVWLINDDETWMVQLQQDRFFLNWRRRGDATYPGFSRSGGVMHVAAIEFARFQEFCAQRHDGEKPNALTINVSKIDVLVQTKHWNDVSEAVQLMPMLGRVIEAMEKPSANVLVRWQEEIDDTTLAISLQPARMRQNPNLAAFRLEFRATQPVRRELSVELSEINKVLNRAFERVIPDYKERFS